MLWRRLQSGCSRPRHRALLSEIDQDKPRYIDRNVVQANGEAFPDDVSLDNIRTERRVG